MSTGKREYLVVFNDWLAWLSSCLSQITQVFRNGDDAELKTLIRKLSAEQAGWAVKLPRMREEFEELAKADPEAAVRICSELWLTFTGRTLPMSKSQLHAEAVELGFPADSVDKLADETIIVYVMEKWFERHMIREPLQRYALAAGVPAEKIAAIEDPMLLAAYLEKMPAAAETGQRQGQDAGNTQPKVDIRDYIPATVAARQKFMNYKQFKRWLDGVPNDVIRRCRPSRNRLLVHAGDWANYWKARDDDYWKKIDYLVARRRGGKPILLEPGGRE
ncbi:hypothetical protein [Thermopirellula anaerolimosa]